VAVGTFGLQSDEALMSVVGALIEIPTMLSLVKLAFVFRSRWVFQKKSDAGATAI
jgi:ACR3 family arsenite transporter